MRNLHGGLFIKSHLTPTYHVSSTTEPNIFLSVYIQYSAVHLHILLPHFFWHIFHSMPFSPPHSSSSSSSRSFQTFAWNPGALACLTANLQPVDLPNTQTSIQVSPGSSLCPHRPHSLSWPMQFLKPLPCKLWQDIMHWSVYCSFFPSVRVVEQ